MNTKLKTTEINEAVAAFAASGFDADEMRSLVTLIEGQTDYVQKRFWKLVDERKAEIRFQKVAWTTVRRAFPCEVREVMACNYSTNTRFIREMDAWSCEDCYAWLKGVA